MTTDSIQYQIIILEKKLSSTPEKILGKYNPGYFALKNLISKKKKLLQDRKVFEFLAR